MISQYDLARAAPTDTLGRRSPIHIFYNYLYLIAK